jgi:hypothetical protein
VLFTPLLGAEYYSLGQKRHANELCFAAQLRSTDL